MRISKDKLEWVTAYSINERYGTRPQDYRDKYDDIFEKDIHDLPVTAQYFLVDQAENILEQYDEYMEHATWQLYKSLLEYVYVPYYRDGSHITEIRIWIKKIKSYLEKAAIDKLGNMDKYTKNVEYKDKYTYAARDLYAVLCDDCAIGTEGYDPSDILPDLNSSCFWDIPEDWIVPQIIPDEIRLENLLNGGIEDIFDKYKPANNKEI